MSGESIPSLTKRAADQRVLGLDIAGKMHPGDTATSFDSITAQVVWSPEESPAALGVSIYSADPIVANEAGREAAQLQFNCTGGTAGTQYLCALHFATPIEALLESLVYVYVL